MLILISPSKTLDFESPVSISPGSDPEFINYSKKLVAILKRKSPRDLASLMDISPKLSELNALRYSEWHYPYPTGKARPVLSAFKGDVYEGLKAWELDSEQIDFADKHLRILSGLYGLLKPTDLMLAYRLEMGTALEGKDFKNLYQFWGDKITRSIKKATKDSNSKTLVNLASEEYAKSVDFKATKARVITPVFNEFRDGTYKFISYNGKRARGLMTRFIIDHKITEPEHLKLFNYEGYEYLEQRSKGDHWVFAR
ncbi:MAG: peroxide stress protein YaaA [Bacteroidales bacterium]|nr:peroxide stress protein YaaA [Bacteroidales bacterium]